MSIDGGDVVEVLGRRVRLVDLSRPVGPTPSEPNPPRVRRVSHEDGAELWEHLFGIPSEALPTGKGFAGEVAELSTHSGTHMDAPWHYAPTSEGEPAQRIDEVPLSRFIGPAVVLDVSDLPTGYLVSPGDVEERLGGLGHALSPGEILLFRTGADEAWGTEEYFGYGCGLGRGAVLHLVERGIRIMGTHAWSLDRPYPLIGGVAGEAGPVPVMAGALRRGGTRLLPPREADQPDGAAGGRCDATLHAHQSRGR